MLNKGIERIASIFNAAVNSRFHILFGSALEDTFISNDYIEISLDEALLQTLKGQGYKRIVFLAPHKAIYFLDEYSRSVTFDDESAKLDFEKEDLHSRQEMRFLKDGPLGARFFLPQRPQNENGELEYSRMGDVFAIRLLDTIMRDQDGPPSAVVFMQAETTLHFFDDPRILAGVVGEWEQLPARNQNTCLFLFSARDYSVLNQISENLIIPELRKTIDNREAKENSTYNIHSIDGPEQQEIQRMIKYVHNLNEVQIDEHNLFLLSDWMSAENRKCRDWLMRMQSLEALNIKIAKNEGWFSSQRDPELSIEDQINSLVGLQEIKTRVAELRSWLEIQQRRSITSYQPLLHMMFLGNPGTGKTTFARLIGEIFHDIGILKRGHLIEVKANDLVAGHVGGTAIKTNTVIDSALDGVLFIDEAYMLTEKDRGGFGQEAVDTLLTRLENDRDRLVVIAAGYPLLMKKFRQSNPGLARRFPEENIFEFADYDQDELRDILHGILNERDLGMDDGIENKLNEIITHLLHARDENFGNAGEMRNLADALERKWAVRVEGEDLPLDTPLSSVDIPTQYDYYLNQNTEKIRELFSELEEFVGLENVKLYLNKLVRHIKLERIRNKQLGKQNSQGIMKHLVFTGNPGTGKTTLARLVGRIYRSMGLLKSGHVVEVSRADLVAGYVGQTAEKTMEKIKDALDGVLFIDEAYALLGNGSDFGSEAVNTLTKAMEDHKDRLLVIMAGYPRETEMLLEMNPGLFSRFETPISFSDFSEDQLIHIFKDLCEKEAYQMDDETIITLGEYFSSYHQRYGTKFGNARFVNLTFNQVKANLAQRTLTDEMLDDEEFEGDEINWITMADIPQLETELALPNLSMLRSSVNNNE